jgi:hypothetical protein
MASNQRLPDVARLLPLSIYPLLAGFLFSGAHAEPPAGVCGKAVATCTSGEAIGKKDDGSTTVWICKGPGTGAAVSCSAADPPINGVCAAKAGTCTAGTPTGVTDNGTATSWTCGGINKGLGAWCSVADPLAPPVNGVCGQKAGACAAGTATGVTDNGTATSWTCAGANKGVGAWCTVADALPPPVNGVCGQKAGACAVGTVTGLTDNGTSTSWTCAGANKGVGAWCTVADALPTPVNGVCGPKAGTCAAGTVTGLSDNGTATSWTCTGANRGLGAWCSVRHAPGVVPSAGQ